jgi:DNA-binding MarR family transcriptional regulator
MAAIDHHPHVTRLPDPPADTFGPVLFECARLLDEIAQAEVNRQAGRRLLTPALVRLLPHLSREGIRPTKLARRVDVTKQAVGQTLAGLTALRLVEHVPDPTDGRARLVRLTEAGAAAYGHGRGVLAFYAAALAERIGRPRLMELAAGLAEVLAVLQQWNSDGAPVPPGVPSGSVGPHVPKAHGRRKRA